MNALTKLARAIDSFNQALGMSVAWIAVLMVSVQFLVVVLRYVFGYGSIFMQESILYMHGFLFLLGAGYTLLQGGHVRVDVFYREAAAKTKAKVDIFGVLVFLLPVCFTILYYSFPYVANSWASLEGSAETSGIPARYILKTAILAFCILLMLQGLSMLIHGVNTLTGRDNQASDTESVGA